MGASKIAQRVVARFLNTAKVEFPEGAVPLGSDGQRVYKDFLYLIGRTNIDKDKLEWDYPALDVVLARMDAKEPVAQDEAKDALDDFDKLAKDYEDENLISWRAADVFRAKLNRLFRSEGGFKIAMDLKGR